MKIININEVACKRDELKEYGYELKRQLVLSLKKYGQLKPLLVCGGKVIEGKLLYECMVEIGFASAFCIELSGELTELQLFDLQLKMNMSGDVNILQLGKKIADKFNDVDDEVIAAETGLEKYRISAIRNILKIKYSEVKEEHVNQSALDL